VLSFASGGGLAFDKNGNLWVSQYLSDAIYEYSKAQLGTSGVQAPIVTLSPSGLVSPSGIAFDGSGNLWFIDANIFGGSPTASAIAAVHELSGASISSSGSPVPTITLSEPIPFITGQLILCFANDITFDTSGDLWGTVNGYYFEFPKGLLGSVSASPSLVLNLYGYPISMYPGTLVVVPQSSIALDATNDLFAISLGNGYGYTNQGFLTLTPAQYDATPPTITSDIGPAAQNIIVGPYVK
jgi:hypothetical protein